MANRRRSSCVMEVVLNGGSAQVSYLGLKCRDSADENGYPAIDKVLPLGEAAAAGVTEQSRIIEVNGVNCQGQSAAQVHAMMMAVSPGTGVRLSLQQSKAARRASLRKSRPSAESIANTITSLQYMTNTANIHTALDTLEQEPEYDTAWV